MHARMTACCIGVRIKMKFLAKFVVLQGGKAGHKKQKMTIVNFLPK